MPLPNLYDLKSVLDSACALAAGVVDAHELLLETNELPSSSQHSKSRLDTKWNHRGLRRRMPEWRIWHHCQARCSRISSASACGVLGSSGCPSRLLMRGGSTGTPGVEGTTTPGAATASVALVAALSRAKQAVRHLSASSSSLSWCQHIQHSKHIAPGPGTEREPQSSSKRWSQRGQKSPWVCLTVIGSQPSTHDG